jgi:hypothetical protein
LRSGYQARDPGSRRRRRPGLLAADQIGGINAKDAGGAVGIVGAQRDLPAGPGTGLHADGLQRDGEQSRGHLFAGGHDRIVFARIVQWREGLAPGHKLIGRAGHGGDDNGHLVAGFHLALDAVGDISDAVEIGDGGAAELHHDAGHGHPRVSRVV